MSGAKTNKRRSARDIETASISSSSSSDSGSSSDEDEDLGEDGDAEGGIGSDYNIYEGVGPDGRPQAGTAGSSVPSASSAAASSIVNTDPKNSTSLTVPGASQTYSTTLLTVAELQVLPQNTTIMCLKASAMQV